MDRAMVRFLSVVVPAYNERGRLRKTLEAMRDYLDGRSLNYEIIVVDDGSRDGTSALVQELREPIPQLRLISTTRNHGKGYAVRAGVMSSRGDYILFADADGASLFPEVEKLEAALAEGCHVAIGSRRSKGPVGVPRKWTLRSPVTAVFNWLVSALVMGGIRDTQCGFKMFPRHVALDLFQSQNIDGFSFDVEILCISRLRGYRIAEVPIHWQAVPGSKVGLVRDGPRMIRDLFRIRAQARRGLYGDMAKWSK